jgi:hypothetical protein
LVIAGDYERPNDCLIATLHEPLRSNYQKSADSWSKLCTDLGERFKYQLNSLIQFHQEKVEELRISRDNLTFFEYFSVQEHLALVYTATNQWNDAQSIYHELIELLRRNIENNSIQFQHPEIQQILPITRDSFELEEIRGVISENVNTDALTLLTYLISRQTNISKTEDVPNQLHESLFEWTRLAKKVVIKTPIDNDSENILVDLWLLENALHALDSYIPIDKTHDWYRIVLVLLERIPKNKVDAENLLKMVKVSNSVEEIIRNQNSWANMFSEMSDFGIAALKVVGKNRTSLFIEMNLLIHLAKHSTDEVLPKLRGLALNMVDSNHTIKSTILNTILKYTKSDELKRLLILDLLSDKQTSQINEEVLAKFFESTNMGHPSYLPFSNYLKFVGITSTLDGKPLVDCTSEKQKHSISIKIHSNLPVFVENVAVRFFFEKTLMQPAVPGSTPSSVTKNTHKEWINLSTIAQFKNAHAPKKFVDILHMESQNSTNSSTPTKGGFVRPINHLRIMDTSDDSSKIKDDNSKISETTPYDDYLMFVEDQVLKQGKNEFVCDISSSDESEMKLEAGFRYCLKAVSVCMGPYVFYEESACRIFAFDMIKRPHKLTLEKQESVCKKPLFTSFVHTIKLKLVIGDDVGGGVCLKLAFDPIELVGIFGTDSVTSSMVMRNGVQLDMDVEFLVDVDEDDNVLLVERLNYVDDSSSLDSNGMDTVSSSRIRLEPNDVVYLRIPICMHGSVYNANNRPGGNADCMSIPGDCMSLKSTTSSSHLKTFKGNPAEKNLVRGTLSAWLEPYQPTVPYTALPELFQFSFMPPIEPALSIRNVIDKHGTITSSFISVKWSNASNEPVSFKSLSCVPLDGLKSTCDLVTVFSTGDCPKAPDSSGNNSRNQSQQSNSSTNTQILHGDSVSVHGSDCGTEKGSENRNVETPNTLNRAQTRTESNPGTVYSGSVSHEKFVTLGRNSSYTVVYELREKEPWISDIATLMCSIQICVGYEECGYSSMGFTLETTTNLPLYLVDLKFDDNDVSSTGFLSAALSLRCLRPDVKVRQLEKSLEEQMMAESDSGRYSQFDKNEKNQALDTASVISSALGKLTVEDDDTASTVSHNSRTSQNSSKTGFSRVKSESGNSRVKHASGKSISGKNNSVPSLSMGVQYEVFDQHGTWAISGKHKGKISYKNLIDADEQTILSKEIQLIPLQIGQVGLPQVTMRRVAIDDKTQQVHSIPHQFDKFQIIFNNKFKKVPV